MSSMEDAAGARYLPVPEWNPVYPRGDQRDITRFAHVERVAWGTLDA